MPLSGDASLCFHSPSKIVAVPEADYLFSVVSAPVSCICPDSFVVRVPCSFAASSSVSDDGIVIQGDVLEDARILLPKKWPEVGVVGCSRVHDLVARAKSRRRLRALL